jgi:hypothetical protein
MAGEETQRRKDKQTNVVRQTIPIAESLTPQSLIAD